jgi:DNA-directed RNA polymerase sigma subunit (sigma70/sigma32)
MMRVIHPPAADLERALINLEVSQQMVLKLRTGLIDGHRHSLREIGAFLGATRSEARSLEWAGWQKLEQLARDDSDAHAAVSFLLSKLTRTRAKKQVAN